MKIIINGSSMVPIYEQLVDQIKNEIINGSMQANDALPSVRALSGELKISALTVKKSYDRLEEDGFIVTIHGKGSFVAQTDRSLALEACKKAIEDEFSNAITKARNFGLTKEEIVDIVSIMLEENI